MLILGTEYGLIRDDETLEETLHGGECAIYTKLIKIRAMEKMLEPSASEEDKRTRYNEVLRHEVIHAFFNECGLAEYCNDEQLVQWIAVQFPKILKVFQGLNCTD